MAEPVRVSAASTILEYLKAQPMGFTFSAHELSSLLGVSKGSVNGFCFRHAAKKHLTITKVQGKPFQYSTTAKLKWKAKARLTPSSGGVAGRKKGAGEGVSLPTQISPPLFTLSELSERLLNLASLAEALASAPPASHIPTEELLAELSRRIGKGA